MASKHHQDDELLSLQSPVVLDVRQDICCGGGQVTNAILFRKIFQQRIKGFKKFLDRDPKL